MQLTSALSSPHKALETMSHPTVRIALFGPNNGCHRSERSERSERFGRLSFSSVHVRIEFFYDWRMEMLVGWRERMNGFESYFG